MHHYPILTKTQTFYLFIITPGGKSSHELYHGLFALTTHHHIKLGNMLEGVLCGERGVTAAIHCNDSGIQFFSHPGQIETRQNGWQTCRRFRPHAVFLSR